MTILGALIPMGSQILSPTKEGFGFPDLMVVMVMLAGAGAGSGHASLFKAAIYWLELWLVSYILCLFFGFYMKTNKQIAPLYIVFKFCF